MVTISTPMRKRLLGAGSIITKLIFAFLILLNLAFLAPGIYYGITLGHYLPLAIGIGGSVAFWVATWFTAKLVMARLRKRVMPRSSETELARR